MLGCRARPPGRAAYICGPASVRPLREEHDRLLIRRRGGPMWPPAGRSGTGPYEKRTASGFAVGAALAAARGPVWDRPLRNGGKASISAVGAGPRPARAFLFRGRFSLSRGEVPREVRRGGTPGRPGTVNQQSSAPPVLMADLPPVSGSPPPGGKPSSRS